MSVTPLYKQSLTRFAWCADTQRPAFEQGKIAPIPFPSLDDLDNPEESQPTAEQPSQSPQQPPSTPEKRYTLQRASSGRIQLQLPPDEAMQGSCIYSWKTTSAAGESLRLVGFTDKPEERIQGYLSEFNATSSPTSAFVRCVRKNPERVSFGIVRPLSPEDEPKLAETQAIESVDSIRRGWNIRLGGGGGRSQPPRAVSLKGASFDDVMQSVRTGVKPLQEIPLQLCKNGRITMTKRIRMREANAIYAFTVNPTGRKEDAIYHIGYTTATARRRLSTHLSCLNARAAKKVRTLKVHRLIRTTLAQRGHVTVTIFDIHRLMATGAQMPLLEKAVMQWYHEHGLHVRNLHAGGRGAISHKAAQEAIAS
jgi:hypothetical protein